MRQQRFLIFARKKVLRVLRTKGIVPLSTKHGTKNLAPLAPWPPHCYLSKLGGGRGGGRIHGPGPAAPPPRDTRDNLSESRFRAVECYDDPTNG